MQAFPLSLLRPLAHLLREAEFNQSLRRDKRQKLVALFHSLYANRIEATSSWEQVLQHAEILGALLHEIDQLVSKALVTKGHPAGKVLEYQEVLYGASSPEKIYRFLTDTVKDLRLGKRNQA